MTAVSAVNFLLCHGGEAPELTVERPRLSHVWPRLRVGLFYGYITRSKARAGAQRGAQGGTHRAV